MPSLENFDTAPAPESATDVVLRNDVISFPPSTLTAANTLQQYFDKSDPAYKQLDVQINKSYDHIAKSTGNDNKLMSQYMSTVNSKLLLQLAKKDWSDYGNAHSDGKTLDKEATKQLLQFRKEEPVKEKQVDDQLAKLRTQVISEAQKNGVKDVDDKYLQGFEKSYFNEEKRSQELRTQLVTKGANCTEASTAATTSGETAAVIPPAHLHHHPGGHHVMHHREHGAAQDLLNKQELARVQGAKPVEVQTQPQAAPASAEVAPATAPAAAPDVWRSHLAAWEVKNFGREYYANVTDDKQRYQLDEAWYARYHGNQAAQPNVAGAYQYNYNTGAYPYNYNTNAYPYNYNGAAYPGAYYPGMYSPLSSFGLGNIGLSFGFGRPWGYNPWAYRSPMFYRPRGFSIIL